MPQYIAKVSERDIGTRLDIFLFGFFKKEKPGLSRSAIQKFILEGQVKLKNAETELKRAHYKVKLNEEFYITLSENNKDKLPKPEAIQLEVIYEDKDLAVINKPVGLVVHPAPGNYEHTLVNALLHRFEELSTIDPRRPGIVHRLDKDTSGLLVVAKNNASHLALAKQFSEHSIKRKYVALVKGKVEFNEDIIEAAIGRHPYKRKNMSVGLAKGARYAKTHYRVLRRSEDFSLLELEPFTGRTHQLRVHLAFIGHPILGDSKYGKDNKFNRLALHAQYIGFMHPVKEKFMEFNCDIPEEFLDIWERREKK